MLKLLLTAGLVAVSEMRGAATETRNCCAVYGNAGATDALL